MSEAADRHERAERILDALTASEDQELAKDMERMDAQVQKLETLSDQGGQGSASP